jgi:hypothetical protein
VRQLLLLALPASILLAACQGGGAGKQAPSSRATPARLSPVGATAPAGTPSTGLPPDVSNLLRSYALVQSDLPDGYTVGLIVDVPNEAALSGYADPQAAQQEMSDAGRIGGIGEQIFPPSDVAASAGISIELFKDTGGAQQWVSQPPALPAEMNPTAADTSQSVGEAMSAIHWTQGGQSGYILNFSRGRIAFGIGVAAPTGQESLDTAFTLAQLLDQKAQQQSS